MRRRRRNRGTWFPVLGTSFSELGSLLSYDRIIQAENIGEPGQEPNTRLGLDIVPLTWDFTQTQNQAAGDPGVSLRDLVEGQDCVIERIVGKIVCGAAQLAAARTYGFLCCAAIGVFPVDDDTQASSLEADDMDPLLAQNSQQPWLWRRTWLLTNYAAANAPGWTYHSESNDIHKGSVLDGPHIDTKGVKRRIRKEQRIFLVLTTYNYEWNGVGAGEANGFVEWCYDVRIFGQMRRGQNKSTFK